MPAMVQETTHGQKAQRSATPVGPFRTRYEGEDRPWDSGLNKLVGSILEKPARLRQSERPSRKRDTSGVSDQVARKRHSSADSRLGGNESGVNTPGTASTTQWSVLSSAPGTRQGRKSSGLPGSASSQVHGDRATPVHFDSPQTDRTEREEVAQETGRGRPTSSAGSGVASKRTLKPGWKQRTPSRGASPKPPPKPSVEKSDEVQKQIDDAVARATEENRKRLKAEDLLNEQKMALRELALEKQELAVKWQYDSAVRDSLAMLRQEEHEERKTLLAAAQSTEQQEFQARSLMEAAKRLEAECLTAAERASALEESAAAGNIVEIERSRQESSALRQELVDAESRARESEAGTRQQILALAHAQRMAQEFYINQQQLLEKREDEARRTSLACEQRLRDELAESRRESEAEQASKQMLRGMAQQQITKLQTEVEEQKRLREDVVSQANNAIRSLELQVDREHQRAELFASGHASPCPSS